MHRMPAEGRCEAGRVGREFSRITEATVSLFGRNVAPGNLRDGFDDLAYREATPIAAIKNARVATGFEIVESDSVHSGEIADMDVVSHAGAIACGKVASKYVEHRKA